MESIEKKSTSIKIEYIPFFSEKKKCSGQQVCLCVCSLFKGKCLDNFWGNFDFSFDSNFLYLFVSQRLLFLTKYIKIFKANIKKKMTLDIESATLEISVCLGYFISTDVCYLDQFQLSHAKFPLSISSAFIHSVKIKIV